MYLTQFDGSVMKYPIEVEMHPASCNSFRLKAFIEDAGHVEILGVWRLLHQNIFFFALLE